MTEYLIAARCDHPLDRLAVMPAEIFFDAIEAELERLGIKLYKGSVCGHSLSEPALERHCYPNETVADA